jgi:hypothetical protein
MKNDFEWDNLKKLSFKVGLLAIARRSTILERDVPFILNLILPFRGACADG